MSAPQRNPGSDRELVDAVLSRGDEAAFRELYRRHTPRLLALVARLLARETMRRLRELSGGFDAEHALRTRETPRPRGFFERLKCLFQGDPAPEPINTFKVDPIAKRVLGNLAPGDAIRVIAEDGPWLQVKTPSSEIAWVYSTFKKQP